MTALVLKQGGPDDGDSGTGSQNGRYEYVQDPISGNIETVWVPDTTQVENPETGEVDTIGRRIECSARAIREGGIRVSSTTERYSTRGTLETADYINFEFGPDDLVTRRDRITDIMNSSGKSIWIEEESTNLPTVFEVTGVIPVTDPWGDVQKQVALLERVDDQGSFWNEQVELREEFRNRGK